MLAKQADKLESQQTQALRNIYGFGVSAPKMRSRSGLEILRSRRVKACTKFAKSLVKSLRFCHWMERRQTSNYPRRGTAVYGEFVEKPAKTDRCYISPLYFYRRLLNGRAEVLWGKTKKIVWGWVLKQREKALIARLSVNARCISLLYYYDRSYEVLYFET